MKDKTTKTVEIELTDEEFLKIAKMAHKKDITFNSMCNLILEEQLKKELNGIKSR